VVVIKGPAPQLLNRLVPGPQLDFPLSPYIEIPDGAGAQESIERRPSAKTPDQTAIFGAPSHLGWVSVDHLDGGALGTLRGAAVGVLAVPFEVEVDVGGDREARLEDLARDHGSHSGASHRGRERRACDVNRPREGVSPALGPLAGVV